MKNFSVELFEKYQKALTSAGIGLWEWNVETNVVKWDSGLQKLYEIPEHIFEGDPNNWYDRIHPDDLDRVKNYLDQAYKDLIEIDSVFRVILPKSGIRYIRSNAYKVRDEKNQITALVGLNWDVTNESVLQNDLKQTKFFLENIMNAIPDPIFVKDNKHLWIFANTEFEKLLGKTKDEFIGKSDYDFFPKNLADGYWAKDNEVFESDNSNENEEKVIDADGKVRDILTKKSSFYLTKTEKILIGVIRDITEKNNIDSRFRLMISLIDSSADLFGFTDASGIPLYINKTGKELFGIEVGDRYFSDYLCPEDKILFDETITPRLRESERWEGEVVAINPKTNEHIPVLLKIFSVRTGPSKKDIFYGCSGTNLTEIKLIQKSLIEQSKMASLGEMAAEIAHELNNPLMIVQAKAQMLQNRIKPDNPDREKIISDLKLIEKNGIRIDKIIKSLKSASRKSDQDPLENVPLLILVEEALELSKDRFRQKEISLKLILDDECNESAYVYARSTEIVQVLVNLLNNSFDAVKNQEAGWVEIHLSCQGPHYQIQMMDSGQKIAPDVAEKMFQPFYTTKPSGQGTGLGLSLSRQIIQSHGGEFYYDAKNLHTNFIFTLKKPDIIK